VTAVAAVADTFDGAVGSAGLLVQAVLHRVPGKRRASQFLGGLVAYQRAVDGNGEIPFSVAGHQFAISAMRLLWAPSSVTDYPEVTPIVLAGIGAAKGAVSGGLGGGVSGQELDAHTIGQNIVQLRQTAKVLQRQLAGQATRKAPTRAT
jgi:hypothetical protein